MSVLFLYLCFISCWFIRDCCTICPVPFIVIIYILGKFMSISNGTVIRLCAPYIYWFALLLLPFTFSMLSLLTSSLVCLRPFSMAQWSHGVPLTFNGLYFYFGLSLSLCFLIEIFSFSPTVFPHIFLVVKLNLRNICYVLWS